MLSSDTSSEEESISPLVAPSDTECPVCGKSLRALTPPQINTHVDECLTKTMLSGENTSTQDKELELFEAEAEFVDYPSPFEVKCPICGLSLDAAPFCKHFVGAHAGGPQNFSCPGDSSFIVKPDTNLTLHIQRAHTELLADPSQKQPRKKLKVSVAEEDDPELLSVIALSKLPPQPQFGTSSIETTGALYTSKECQICLELYQTADTVVRLDCLCLFHKKCVEKWFDHHQNRECPNHPRW